MTVGCQNRVFQCVCTKLVSYFHGSAPLGYPCQRQPWILQYPRLVEFTVNIKADPISPGYGTFDKFRGYASVYLVRIVTGILDKVAYQILAQINACDIAHKALDAVIRHALHNIEIYRQSPDLGRDINGISGLILPTLLQQPQVHVLRK